MILAEAGPDAALLFLPGPDAEVCRAFTEVEATGDRRLDVETLGS